MRTTEEIILNLKEFAKQLERMLGDGLTLRQISQATYRMREEGANIPYMSIIQTEKDKSVSRLMASPINPQKDLKSFFNECRLGGRLPRYTFAMELAGVEFYEVVVKGGERRSLK